jgi:DNA-binding CsgD family transcriptional regulator
LKKFEVKEILSENVNGFVVRGRFSDKASDDEDAVVVVTQNKVQLSDQERAALTLYASGLKMSAVARRMGVSEPTINEYIKRVRAKYSTVGNPLPTKVHLYRLAQSEGWLD